MREQIKTEFMGGPLACEVRVLPASDVRKAIFRVPMVRYRAFAGMESPDFSLEDSVFVGVYEIRQTSLDTAVARFEGIDHRCPPPRRPDMVLEAGDRMEVYKADG